ncbi:MAG: glycosyltransferase [Bacteroidales bacterium]|jgi:glycosyltransferase involved in cell wall biosynthesis|nr:glycosyltransferase [Bacteroidales bacterium]
MAKNFQIGIVIATAFQRTNLLFDRSLKSVLSQTYLPDFIVIVDDNKNENEFEIIAERATQLNNPNVFCIRNFKTKHNSGTGAWNSGVDFLCEKFENTRNGYIAILDDDDE